MSDGVKETPCTRCTHRTVCKHKDDFLKAVQAVNEATVHEHEDGNRVKMTKVINFQRGHLLTARKLHLLL